MDWGRTLNVIPVCAAIAINLGYYTDSDTVVVDSK